jgi:uncharacterized membrane protein YuzA (DUF378 family)
MKALNIITLVLIIVGSLNWGLVAMNANLVAGIFGEDTAMTNIIYGLVGLAALWQLIPLLQSLRTPSAQTEVNRTL